MDKAPLAVVILAAGRGVRMKSALPKAAHEVAGKPLIGWVLDAVGKLKPERVVAVLAPDMNDLAAALKPFAVIAVQEKPLGTGDAVRAALPALKGFTGDVLILLGDMPLISAATLEALIHARHRDKSTGLSVLGAEFERPPAFGRMVRGADGSLIRIVEDKDCTPAERSIKLCNLGAFCIDGAKLADWTGKIGDANAQKEFYLTDIVQVAVADGAKAHVHVVGDHAEAQGVNSRADLAGLERMVQNSLRLRAMEQGATLLDPDTVWLSWDTSFGQDVIVEPHVWFGPGVTVADNVHIKAFSHIEGAGIATGATIGPFARLRPGTIIGTDALVGNFVEIKNATLGAGAKANHLAYIGDADIGPRTNFSCGAITANYDGVNKNKTIIGSDVMVGSNVTLVAPVTVGNGAYLAAGSTINKDVPADALAIARDRQTVVEGWAKNKKKKAG
jgi:bifunctional UDP-N-acetylglucosamine pyrophosphorylase / glucosamine-1-phosphate N-acetyltransferase